MRGKEGFLLMSFKNAKRNATEKKNAVEKPGPIFRPSKEISDEWPNIFSRNEQGETVFRDPRPDLDRGDGEELVWGLLIASAFDRSRDLAGSLHGFRCMGTRLVREDKGWKMVPGGEWGPGEYEQARQDYLLPHKPLMIKLLNGLGE